MLRGRVWIGVSMLLSLVAISRADECDLNDPTLLLPDLVAMPPTKVRNVPYTGHRAIIFTSTIGNVGDGPLIVQGKTVDTPDGPKTQATQEVWRKDGTSCTHLAGYFIYHPTHKHFHIQDFSSYQLRKDDPFTGPIVAESEKVSFCLLDITQLRGYNGQRQLNDLTCLSSEGEQGISVGFADVYDSFLPGQLIDLDADPQHPVPAGEYFLVNVANPDGVLLEKHGGVEANAGVVSVSVPPPLRNPDGPPPSPSPSVSPSVSPSPSPSPKPTPPRHPSPPAHRTPLPRRTPHPPHAPHSDPHMPVVP